MTATYGEIGVVTALHMQPTAIIAHHLNLAELVAAMTHYNRCSTCEHLSASQMRSDEAGTDQSGTKSTGGK